VGSGGFSAAGGGEVVVVDTGVGSDSGRYTD
jgi:hypothetical protein